MEQNLDLKELEHHKQLELCKTRPAYRQGKKLTAVKAYTINSESPHLYVYGVPSVNLRTELKSLFDKYGQIIKIHIVPNVKTEMFTECYHVQYQRIQSARIAKRFVDNKNFYGGVLHVCYAPEIESVEETRRKLFQRNKDVLTRLKNAGPLNDYTKQKQFVELDMSRLNRKRKHPALEITEEKLARLDSNEVWKGIPSSIDPRLAPSRSAAKFSEPSKHYQMKLPKGKEYGPTATDLVETVVLEEKNKKIDGNSTNNPCGPRLENEAFVIHLSQPPVLPTKLVKGLVPMQVIKSVKLDNNKKIVFRKNKNFNLMDRNNLDT